MRILVSFLFLTGLYAQTPPITSVGSDSVTDTTARIYWTAGFYHDTSSDTTLTTGFTTSGTCANVDIVVGDTTNFKVSGVHSNIIMGGVEWARVNSKSDSTHANITFNCSPGASDGTEWFYSTRAGLSFSVSSNVATATLYYPMPAWWIAGHHFLIRYARTNNLSNEDYVISSVIDSTHFTFTTSGVADGTYDSTTDSDIWVESTGGFTHIGGETISLLNTDEMVCYGPSAGTYTHSATFLEDGSQGYPDAAQSSKHYVYLGGQTPGSTIHYIVLSTPRQFSASDCSSIGTHTGQSTDQTITFTSGSSSTLTAPSGVSFSTAPISCTGISVTVASDCSDFITKLATARSTSGNHCLLIPAGSTCTAPASTGFLLPVKSGGSGITEIRTDALDSNLPAQGACLPPLTPGLDSPCIDNSTYAPYLATIQTGDPSSPAPVFSIAPYTKADDIYFGPGLKLQANPHYTFRSRTPIIKISHDLGDGQYDHASHSSGIIVDRVYFYQKSLRNGSISAVEILGGNSNAVIDSVIEGTGSRTQDEGGIDIASQDPYDGGFIIKNNRIMACSNAFFFGENGWNTSNIIVQRNYFHMSLAWNGSNKEFTTQDQISISSITPASPTVIVPTDPIESDLGYSPIPVSFSGFTGTNWSTLNAKYFELINDTLTDFTCDGTHCTATVPSHGLSVGQYVFVSGIGHYPCRQQEQGVHQISVVPDSDHFQYNSGTNSQCIWPAVFVMAPVFYTGGTSTSFTISTDSSTWGAATGTPIVRYGWATDAKNLGECKTCRFVEISGNLFENSIANQQSAAAIVLTVSTGSSWQDINNYGATAQISDINIHDNWFRSIGQFMPLLGVPNNGTAPPMSRISVTNTLVTDSSELQCQGGESCNLPFVTVSPGTNMVFNHITGFNSPGPINGAWGTPPALGDLTYTNSIAQFGSGFVGPSDNLGNLHQGGQLYQTSGTGATPNPPYPDLLTWGRNVLIGDNCLNWSPTCNGDDPWVYKKQYYNGGTAGSLVNDYQSQYWPTYDSGVVFAGSTNITAASNTSPIILTTESMSCIPDVGDRVRVNGVKGNDATTGMWVAKASDSIHLTLLASIGNAAYISGGTVIPLTGHCNIADNWALGSSSPYKAGVSHIAPAADGSTAGQGPALDSTDVGVNIDTLKATIAGCYINGTTPNANVGDVYSTTLTANDCTSSSFTITSGSLSGSGLSLNSSTGEISGTAALANTYNFTVSYDTASSPHTIIISNVGVAPSTSINGVTTFNATVK